MQCSGCDTCGTSIQNVSDGWVEWQTRNDNGTWVKQSPRLVHHRPSSPNPYGCQYDEAVIHAQGRNIVGDLALDQFVGPDGLIILLSFLSDGYFELEQSLELIKKIQVQDSIWSAVILRKPLERAYLSPTQNQATTTLSRSKQSSDGL